MPRHISQYVKVFFFIIYIALTLGSYINSMQLIDMSYKVDNVDNYVFANIDSLLISCLLRQASLNT